MLGEKKIWGSLRKGQKNLGVYGQKIMTLDISRRYIDYSSHLFRSKKAKGFLGLIFYFLGLKSLKNKV